MSLDCLPASVAFCDVETTGLGNQDRIISFGGIGMISRDLTKGRPGLAYLYLVFDPGRRNNRAAERIHGFTDSALRQQDPFAVHAADIWRFLTSHELIVAHNAAFDLRFINREMILSGLPALTRPVYCTMKAYRARQRRFECCLRPHQARSCWRSARCSRGRLARNADLSLAPWLPASASVAQIASAHSLQLASH
jgi:DNA polymerase III subunit epsilon